MQAQESNLRVIAVTGTIEDCIMGDEGSADWADLTPQSKRLKLIEPIKVDIANLRIRQPAHGDPIIEVIHERNGPEGLDGPDDPDDWMAFYLGGLHAKQPLAATAFSTSHYGPLNNEPPHIAARRLEEMVAVITKMLETDMGDMGLAKILTGACKYSHSPMTFDTKDLATKLRLIADGSACEFVSYTALRTS